LVFFLHIIHFRSGTVIGRIVIKSRCSRRHRVFLLRFYGLDNLDTRIDTDFPSKNLWGVRIYFSDTLSHLGARPGKSVRCSWNGWVINTYR
jgi:hypothetical protein